MYNNYKLRISSFFSANPSVFVKTRKHPLFSSASSSFVLKNIPIKSPCMIDMNSSIHSMQNFSSVGLKMVSSRYEDAIGKLNSLQTNASVLQNARGGITERTLQNVPATLKYLSRVGINENNLDKLPVIHVTGTKGKGSTCAFTEKIVRQHGYRTGLYTSPHLVAVTERIRLDGQPIPKEEFSKYFFQVYDALTIQKDDEYDMPAYFKFLTVLAFKIFIEEGVDVGILEVGIGGEYDCTNVVRKPIACGISSLDYDHTSLLGNSLSSIAWHKAGIMKNNVPIFTVPGHDSEASDMLMTRASEKVCPLFECPSLHEYGWHSRPIHLGLAGEVQLLNASLALQLAHTWLNWKKGEQSVVTSKGNVESALPFSLSEDDILALKHVAWPGRSQVMKLDSKFTVFLDGAHTPNSMTACTRWFNDLATFQSKFRSKRTFKILVFNSTGDRDPQNLLFKLAECNFDLAIFTTNIASVKPGNSDQTNLTVSEKSQHLRCQRHLEVWNFLKASKLNSVDKLSTMGSDLTDSNRNDSNSSNADLKNTISCSNSYVLEQSLKNNIYHLEKSQQDTNKSLDATHMLQLNQIYPEVEREEGEYESAVIIPHIEEAFQWVCDNREEMDRQFMALPIALKQAESVQILVTGSLHLVGGVLGVLEPKLRSPKRPLSDQMREEYMRANVSTPGAP